jgi:hypothetical protein
VSEEAAEQLLVNLRFLRSLHRPLYANELDQPCDKIAHRENEIRNSRSDRTSRHGRVFGLLGVLHQNDPARLFDGAHPDGPV